MFNVTLDEDFNRRKNALTCCLVDSGVRCIKPAGNACYNKRIQKTIQQRRLKFYVDEEVTQHFHIKLLTFLSSGSCNVFNFLTRRAMYTYAKATKAPSRISETSKSLRKSRLTISTTANPPKELIPTLVKLQHVNVNPLLLSRNIYIMKY